MEDGNNGGVSVEKVAGDTGGVGGGQVLPSATSLSPDAG